MKQMQMRAIDDCLGDLSALHRRFTKHRQHFDELAAILTQESLKAKVRSVGIEIKADSNNLVDVTHAGSTFCIRFVPTLGYQFSEIRLERISTDLNAKVESKAIASVWCDTTGNLFLESSGSASHHHTQDEQSVLHLLLNWLRFAIECEKENGEALVAGKV